MAGLSIRGLRKSYGKVPVIHGLDVEIADGSFVVIVGPSGCGKSTLLRMVAGLESVDAGEIAIDGRVINRLEPAERDIAMVFQTYALYPHMSVFDNMAYGLKIARLPQAEIARRVEQAAALLQLQPLLQRKPRQLSGGQRQRVAMGRAIVRDPAVFLFDEPLSNLDAKLRVQMRLEIKQLQRRLGTTSLYVTHDQVEAMTLGDRLIVMNGGVAEQIDAPLAIYERPATVFVAGFIGSPAMNLVPARLGEGRVEVGGAALPWEGRGGGPVTLGVRPEHLVPDGTGPLVLTVELVEALGADTLAYGRLADGDAIAQGGALAVRLPGGSRVALGETLRLAPQPGSLHLFDGQSGKRLN